ncbi:hypothetical protein [Lacticaseibacillus parakribbianus]|uniref:hypothetical protein n=1 Tax=Lacticaseibacillus parakribbianus TaxID=2970927 RepID=UPI0021CB1F79|nr:hypothetical protein [Lacticaseibacillus parakribbianus]
MKLILCQPAITRFEWELEVFLTNAKAVGFRLADIVLLFAQSDQSVPQRLAKKYGVEVHVYQDQRENKIYQPSVKPYLWWRYLAEDSSREHEKYFYIDSDVIFRARPDFRTVNATPDRWYCSDTVGYLSLDYIRQCRDGPTVLSRMAEIVGVTTESLETINHNSGGAQWVIKDPSAEYWGKVYRDSVRLYEYLLASGSDIQVWTAEMWAQLWNMMYFNIGPMVSPELAFCWPTDPVDRWGQVKLLHNAGVTPDDDQLFFKGQYTDRTPFGDDLNFVDPARCSVKYVDAIKAVMIDGNT